MSTKQCTNCNGAGYFLRDFEIPGGGERHVTSSGYECEICYGAGTLPEPSAPRLLPPLDGDPIPRVSWSWSDPPPGPIPRRSWRWRPYRATEPFEAWVYGEGDAVTGIPPGVTVEIESRLTYDDDRHREIRGPWLHGSSILGTSAPKQPTEAVTPVSPSLAAFLTARIDEDERNRDDLHSRDCATAGPIAFSCDCGWPARMQAECNAKRAIIEHWGPFETIDGPELLKHLAVPYADHPDWREEWLA